MFQTDAERFLFLLENAAELAEFLARGDCTQRGGTRTGIGAAAEWLTTVTNTGSASCGGGDLLCSNCLKGEAMAADETRVCSTQRGGRIVVAHKAASFEDAERWDLDFWLRLAPAARLDALEQIRMEWEAIRRARDQRLP